MRNTRTNQSRRRLSIFGGLILMLVMVSCSKNKIDSGAHILVFGHGGAGIPTVFKNLPMNSMEAMEVGLEEEMADGIEVDVQLSSDSVLILFHDGKLESGSDCEGCIVSSTAEEIFACRHKKVLWGTPDEEFNLVGLETMLDRFFAEADPPWLSLDLKVNQCDTDYQPYIDRFARQLVQTFEDKAYTDRVIFESGNLDLLSAIHDLDDELIIFGNFGEVETLLAEDKFENDYDWMDGVIITLHNITKEEVDQLHDLGLQVAVYGVKLKGNVVDAAEKGVDMMQVEKVPMTLETLGKN